MGAALGKAKRSITSLSQIRTPHLYGLSGAPIALNQRKNNYRYAENDTEARERGS
jgi:hypothetical protein